MVNQMNNEKVPKPPYTPDPNDIPPAYEKVKYEIRKLADTFSFQVNATDLLLELPKERREHLIGANFEALLLHLRNVVDFLQEKDSDKRDDIRPIHFCSLTEGKKKGGKYEQLWIRLNTELSHLTYARCRRVGADKKWDLNQIKSVMEDVLKFLRLVQIEKSSSGELKKMDLRESTQSLINHVESVLKEYKNTKQTWSLFPMLPLEPSTATSYPGSSITFKSA